jgi:hypothetical protein
MDLLPGKHCRPKHLIALIICRVTETGFPVDALPDLCTNDLLIILALLLRLRETTLHGRCTSGQGSHNLPKTHLCWYNEKVNPNA